MISKALTVRNKLGLHARAAGALVRLAGTFDSEITLEKGDMRANAKSIMGLLMLAAAQGSSIVVSAKGEDEKEAFAAVEDHMRRKFHEE
jgi:phosphotransferase system HPr (HPr) family protein